MTATITAPTTWDDMGELFASAMPGYSERVEQTRLAHSIEKAFENTEWLLGQGPTGVGKSFAGLVPAALWAVHNDKTVVVATATKALQDQLSAKDLPFLSRVLSEAGVPFGWSVLKGRSNYACLERISDGKLTAEQVFNLGALREELERADHTGDLDDVVTELDLTQRNLLVSSADDCLGKTECRYGSVCFAEKARERAKKAHIVVVNHSILMMDARTREITKGRYGILPHYDAVIVDEGHLLESYASSALGSRITRRTLTAYARDAVTLLGDPLLGGPLQQATKALFAEMTSLLDEEQSLRVDGDELIRLASPLVAAFQSVAALGRQIRDLEFHGEDAKLKTRKRLLKRTESLLGHLREIGLADEDEMVRWISTEITRDKTDVLSPNEPLRDVVLQYAPLHVGPFLARNIWHSVPVEEVTDDLHGEPEETDVDTVPHTAVKRPVILMSATLAVGTDFSFAAKTAGFGTDYRSFAGGSPFDYRKRAGLYVAEKGWPAQGSAAWQGKVISTMSTLVQAAGGRSLLLFTSRRAMQEAHAVLAEEFVQELGVQVLMQGKDYTNKELADRFRTDETSVLFGLQSFMTGIDIQGPSLSLVALDKVPFTSPGDVLHSARCDAMDRAVAEKKGYHGPLDKIPASVRFHRDAAFFGRSVPEATLVLLQAIGRLIRTTEDEGVMAVLDSRLETKGYGKTILDALPPARRLETLREAKDYLAELEERRDG